MPMLCLRLHLARAGSRVGALVVRVLLVAPEVVDLSPATVAIRRHCADEHGRRPSLTKTPLMFSFPTPVGPQKYSSVSHLRSMLPLRWLNAYLRDSVGGVGGRE